MTVITAIKGSAALKDGCENFRPRSLCVHRLLSVCRRKEMCKSKEIGFNVTDHRPVKICNSLISEYLKKKSTKFEHSFHM